MKSAFKTDLEIRSLDRPAGKRGWELISPLVYESGLLRMELQVPARYTTDFASVPRFFWRIFPPTGQYGRATVIHDYLCDLEGSTGIDSKTTHKVFREAMKVLNVPGWKVTAMYNAVRWFGPRFKAVR